MSPVVRFFSEAALNYHNSSLFVSSIDRPFCWQKVIDFSSNKLLKGQSKECILYTTYYNKTSLWLSMPFLICINIVKALSLLRTERSTYDDGDTGPVCTFSLAVHLK